MRLYITLALLIVISVILVSCSEEVVSEMFPEEEDYDNVDAEERFVIDNDQYKITTNKESSTNTSGIVNINIITDKDTKCEYIYVKEFSEGGQSGKGYGGITPLLNEDGEPTCN